MLEKLITDPPLFFVISYVAVLVVGFFFTLAAKKSIKVFFTFSVALVFSFLYFYFVLDTTLMNVVQKLPFPYKP